MICLSILAFSCKKEIIEPQPSSTISAAGGKVLTGEGGPHIKIAVVSDIHYMDPSLLRNGAENQAPFQDYLAQDPKLVQFSSWIFQQVVSDLKTLQPDLLLVPGDLTKDGELVSHQAVAGYLDQLRLRGTKVFVIPGNHDINNAKAVQYDGAGYTQLPRTQVADFTTIYKNFGYDQTDRDPASLSYLAKPYNDLWILSIDASEYETYGPEGDKADGRIKDATMTWALEKLAQAKQQGVTVFGLMHHNLVEHYSGQTQLDPGYVVDNWQTRVKQLMDAGLRIIFTGHYHANDITGYVQDGKQLYDIETGSLVTPPSPYRIVTVKNKKLEIRTNTVQSIATTLPGDMSFTDYSAAFLSQHLDGYFQYYLTNRLGVPPDLAAFASPLLRNGAMAHFAGDEKMPPDQRAQINTLAGMSAQLAEMATTLWTDLGVKDNTTVVPYDK